MSKKLSRQEYEVYRKKAVELYNEKNLTQKAIGELLGVAQSAVSSWIKKSQTGDESWHRHKKGTGAPPKISDADFLEVLSELEQGAEAYGFEGEYWTAGRISRVMEEVLGVKYDPDHLSRKLRQAKWSFKNPLLKARQQSAAKVSEWKEERLPNLKKKSIGK